MIGYLAPEKLLPCPFCGAKAKRVDFDGMNETDENTGGSCIVCTRCNASSAVVFGYKQTLYSSWNERVAARAKVGRKG